MVRARTLWRTVRRKNDDMGGKTPNGGNLEQLVANANAHESPRSVDDNDVGVTSNYVIVSVESPR
jgi:hypothetical protein